jgi:magnesium-transporting ATPase (P-type)
MTKGADSIIIPRLLPGQDQLIEHTVSFLEECANEGLRTLLIAQKEVDPDFYEEWNKKYSNALSSFKDRQKQIDEVSEIIENDFILIGSTAIEDKLQDNVGEVISFIKQAGIKLWVLTGDKIETAINIGFSCEVLDKEMEIFIINET